MIRSKNGRLNMRTTLLILSGALALTFFGCASDCATQCDDSTVIDARADSVGGKQCGAYVLIPATYETVCEEVEVEAARVDNEKIAAVYQTVTVKELVTPGRWTQEVIPAAYRTETERVMVTPARREWQKVPCASVNLQSGEKLGDAYCLVEIPAVYSNQSKQCLTTAACTKRNYIPAVYRDVQREVLVREECSREIPIPAKSTTRTSQRLVTPARWEWRWGDECPADERDMPQKASEISPAPPFPVGGSQPNLTITDAS